MKKNPSVEPLRTKRLAFRVSTRELAAIERSFAKSYYSGLAEYIRAKALGHKVRIKYRNESLDNYLAEVIPLKEKFLDLLQQVETSGQRWDPGEKAILKGRIDQILETLVNIYNACTHT